MADKKDFNVNSIIIHGSKQHTMNAIVAALLSERELLIENPYPNIDNAKYNTYLTRHGYEILFDVIFLYLNLIAKSETTPIITADNVFFHIDDILALTLALRLGEKVNFLREANEDYDRALLILRRFGVRFTDDNPEKPSSVMQIESFTLTKIKFNFLKSNYYLAGFLARVSAICGVETEVLSKINIFDSLPDEIYPLNLNFQNLQQSAVEVDELEKRLQKLQGNQKDQSFHYRIIAANNDFPEKFTLNADALIRAYLAILAVSGKAETIHFRYLHVFETDRAFIKILGKLGANAEIVQIKNSEESVSNFMKVSAGKPVAKKTNERLMRICNYAFGPLALLACFAEGKTVIRGLAKSSSLWRTRIDGITSILSTADVRVGEIEDGIVIEPPQELSDIVYDKYDDPYLMLSQFSAAAAINRKPLSTEYFDFSKHYPQFQEYLNAIRTKTKSLVN